MRFTTAFAALSLALMATSAVQAQALRDNWCSDVHIRFFVGGAEGDGFGTIVFNGAKQAQADTGAQVDFVFSGWSVREDGAAAARSRGFGTRRHRDDGPPWPGVDRAAG